MGSGRPLVLDRNTEDQIAQCLIGRARIGFPCGKSELLDLVQAYIEANNFSTPFTNSRPGDDWYRAFMHRNPTLSLKKPEQLQKCRATARVPDVIYDFYDLLKAELDKHDLHDKPFFVYNCDESGFPSDPSKMRAIGKKGEHLTRLSGGSGKDSTTVLACGNALGVGLPPLILFSGKAVQPRWVRKNDYPGTMYATSQNGWMEETVFFNWLEKMFIPQVEADRSAHNMPDQQALLIFDGHSSHYSLRIVELALKHNITLFRLPSHLTDKLQPLDVTVFNPVKFNWEKKLIDHGRKQIGKGSLFVTKDIFSKFIAETWNDFMKPANLKKGFEATGILPFNPEKFDKTLFNKIDLEKYESRKRQIEKPKNAAPLPQPQEPPQRSFIFVENPKY